MNIYLDSLYSYSASFLKEKIVPSLTDRQKDILLIASIALNCLAACYFIFRCLKEKPLVNENLENSPLNNVLPLPLDEKADPKDARLYDVMFKPAIEGNNNRDDFLNEQTKEQEINECKLEVNESKQETNENDQDKFPVALNNALSELITEQDDNKIISLDVPLQQQKIEEEGQNQSSISDLLSESEFTPVIKKNGHDNPENDFVDVPLSTKEFESNEDNVEAPLEDVEMLFEDVEMPLEDVEMALLNDLTTLSPVDSMLLKLLHENAKGLDHISPIDKLEMAKKAGKFLESLSLQGVDLTNEQLQEVLNACPNLKMLDLTGCTRLTDAVIKDLPRDLKDLNLCGCYQLTDAGMVDLPQSLKKLTLARCGGLTDNATKKLPISLEKLDLSGCYKLSDEAIYHLPQGIKKLGLSSCTKLTDAAINFLPRGVKILDLSKCLNLTDRGMKDLPINLKKLDLSDCIQLTDAAIKNLPRKLIELDLSNFYHQLTDAAIRDLPGDLEILNLSKNH